MKSSCLLLPFLLLGCASRQTYDSSNATISKPLGLSELVGSYKGTWSANNGDTGTITFQIDAYGNLTGEEGEDGDRPVGQIVGTMNKSGELNATCHYEGHRPDPVTGQFGTNAKGKTIARVVFHHRRKTVDQVYFLERTEASSFQTSQP